ncbi:MAG: hypothetical protein WCS65_05225 [Verrucomicrobiae bacterium]
MNSRILILLLTLASAAIMAGATGDSLDLRSTGDIFVATDSLGELQICLEVEETSQGRWCGVSPKQKASPASGKSVEGELVYVFPDRAEVTMTIKGKIDAQDVTVKAAWATESTAKGFARLNLKIAGDDAKDLTIEENGKPVFVNFDKARNLAKLTELVFRRTSTGAFLFKLTGDIAAGCEMIFNQDNPDSGLVLRLNTVPVGMDSCISDVKETGWALSFKE